MGHRRTSVYQPHPHLRHGRTPETPSAGRRIPNHVFPLPPRRWSAFAQTWRDHSRQAAPSRSRNGLASHLRPPLRTAQESLPARHSRPDQDRGVKIRRASARLFYAKNTDFFVYVKKKQYLCGRKQN